MESSLDGLTPLERTVPSDLCLSLTTDSLLAARVTVFMLSSLLLVDLVLETAPASLLLLSHTPVKAPPLGSTLRSRMEWRIKEEKGGGRGA